MKRKEREFLDTAVYVMSSQCETIYSAHPKRGGGVVHGQGTELRSLTSLRHKAMTLASLAGLLTM